MTKSFWLDSVQDTTDWTPTSSLDQKRANQWWVHMVLAQWQQNACPSTALCRTVPGVQHGQKWHCGERSCTLILWGWRGQWHSWRMSEGSDWWRSRQETMTTYIHATSHVLLKQLCIPTCIMFTGAVLVTPIFFWVSGVVWLGGRRCCLAWFPPSHGALSSSSFRAAGVQWVSQFLHKTSLLSPTKSWPAVKWK